MSDARRRELERAAAHDPTAKVAWLQARIRAAESSNLRCCDSGSSGTRAVTAVRANLGQGDSLHGTTGQQEAGRPCGRCHGTKLLPFAKAVELAAWLGDQSSCTALGWPPSRAAHSRAPRLKRSEVLSWCAQLQDYGQEVMVRASVAAGNYAFLCVWRVAHWSPAAREASPRNAAYNAIKTVDDWLACPCVEHEKEAEAARATLALGSGGIGVGVWASAPYGAIGMVSNWPSLLAACADVGTATGMKAAIASALVPVALA